MLHTYQEKCVDESRVNVSYGLQSYERLLNGGGPKLLLEKAVELLAKVNLSMFTQDMSSRLLSQKGVLLSRLGRDEEADQFFSAAAQLTGEQGVQQGAFSSQTVWKQWATHLEKKFDAGLKKALEQQGTDE